ncbi:MAG: YHS domain-containing protein [Phycisphaerales bacterium]|nr:MAG: YHS domain-containing protein [Phycisphaerales bacterium]
MSIARVSKTAIVVLVGMLLITLTMLPGCKKEEEQQASVSAETQIKEVASAAAEEIVQTTCPVMEGEIDKNIFVEYKGKKVYFCCPPCAEKFKENPEQYLAKLPQFKQ